MTALPLAENALEGTHNFRSLIGTPILGGTIGTHWLLRADHLHALTAVGWRQLSAMNTRSIIDLRSHSERNAAPTHIPLGLSIDGVHLPVDNDFRANPLLAQGLADDPSPAAVSRWMMSIYQDFPKVFAPLVQSYVAHLMTPEGATLVHCTAGKDRTGFAVALILYALGTPPDDIMADYLRSSPREGLQDRRLPGLVRMFKELYNHTLTPAAVLPILGVEPAYLAAAFNALDHEHGGVHRYLARHAGLDQAGLEQLRERALRAA